jgi:hypothetical protein
MTSWKACGPAAFSDNHGELSGGFSMKASFRTFVVLPAIALALIALPSVVMAAGSQSLGATVSSVFGSPAVIEQTSPLPTPTPGGTVPPPTPRPRPPAPRPQPQPAYPTPTPVPSSSTGASLGTYKLVKVIGDRLSSTIYAYTNNGWLFRSDLDGRGWTLVTTEPAVQDFVMSASNPDILYSGAGPDCTGTSVSVSAMYKSEDGGETWVELPTGLDLKPMLVDQGNPDNVFAADCAALYLSTDGGETWTPKPDAAADNLWQTFTPVDMSSGSLVGSPRPETPHWDQIFAAGNDAQLAGVVAFTGDGGATWANITNPEQAPTDIRAVVASLTEGGKVWVVDSKGVWSTSDYGVNWTLSNQGLEYLAKINISFNDLTYAANGKLYLATGAGLYIQSEPNAPWKLATDVDFRLENMQSLLLTETSPQRLWINALDADGDPIVFSMLVK